MKIIDILILTFYKKMNNLKLNEYNLKLNYNF